MAEANWRVNQPFEFVERGKKYHGTYFQLNITIDSGELELRDFIVNTIHKYRPDAHIGDHLHKGANARNLTISAEKDTMFFYNGYHYFLNHKQSDADVAAFLKGMFEGDGCAYSKDAFGYVVLTQADKNEWKLNTVKSYLNQLNIPFIDEHSSIRQTHHLRIEPLNLAIFKSIVGFLSKKKSDKLSSITKHEYSRVQSIEHVQQDSIMWELLVDGNHDAQCYFVNGIRSHNSTDKRLRLNTEVAVIAKKIKKNRKVVAFRYVTASDAKCQVYR
jgi:hypothetical protein